MTGTVTDNGLYETNNLRMIRQLAWDGHMMAAEINGKWELFVNYEGYRVLKGLGIMCYTPNDMLDSMVKTHDFAPARFGVLPHTRVNIEENSINGMPMHLPPDGMKQVFAVTPVIPSRATAFAESAVSVGNARRLDPRQLAFPSAANHAFTGGKSIT